MGSGKSGAAERATQRKGADMIIGVDPVALLVTVVPMLLLLALLVLAVVLCVLAIRWFLRQERASKDPESMAARRSLAEVLRSHRKRCNMTQEFVAEKVGVSRQAVSKWESGASEPSTTNLMKVARLYGVDPAELLREVTS